MDLDAVNEKVEDDFYTFLHTAHAKYEIESERSRNENILYTGSLQSSTSDQDEEQRVEAVCR